MAGVVRSTSRADHRTAAGRVARTGRADARASESGRLAGTAGRSRRVRPRVLPLVGGLPAEDRLDFNKRKLALQRATVKPVELAILWVTETSGHGVLSSVTSSRRFGMLDASALLEACTESAIGQWWAGHRGLLVQTIVSLDAHVFSVSPPLSLAIIRRYGPGFAAPTRRPRLQFANASRGNDVPKT